MTDTTNPAEVQPTGAEATAPGSLPLPYAYQVDRPAPHRPDGIFRMSYGTWDTAPGPITTVQHAAEYEAARVRVEHAYFGPLTVRVWPHRGEDERRHNLPPDTAYVLQLPDQTDTINPNTKAAVETAAARRAERAARHNPVYMLCVPCHQPKARKKRGTPGTTEGSTGGSSG